jgi:hypothetical protein
VADVDVIPPAAVRILKQYERGVQFRLGRLKDGPRGPGLIFIIPLVDHVRRVSLRIVTMPIQSQGIITRDNVSVDIAAVAYYRVKDAVRSVIAIEDVAAAIDQIAQTTLRSVVGQHTLDEALAETDRINQHIREILDVQTEDWGVEVTLVELKDTPARVAAAKPADADRDLRRQELDRRLPRAAHEHDPGAGGVPRSRGCERGTRRRHAVHADRHRADERGRGSGRRRGRPRVAPQSCTARRRWADRDRRHGRPNRADQLAEPVREGTAGHGSAKSLPSS